MPLLCALAKGREFGTVAAARAVRARKRVGPRPAWICRTIICGREYLDDSKEQDGARAIDPIRAVSARMGMLCLQRSIVRVVGQESGRETKATALLMQGVRDKKMIDRQGNLIMP